VAINSLQVAWLSRLARKGIISPGQSIVEFSPQDIMASRRAVRHYGLRHNHPDQIDRMLDDIFDGEKGRADGIPAFYRLFGIERYRCTDLLDPRVDWTFDFNDYVKLNEQFDLVTNFGTAEHVFNIGQLFHSIHDAVRPGGVALHVLPTFGDINHGFYNIHPTVYFDLAAANNYTIEDIFYGDRWDIRNKMLEANLDADFDFDAVPIQMEQMKDRSTLQRLVTQQFVANFNDPDTQRYGASYPGILYDYCAVALRKSGGQAFQMPMQDYYGSRRPLSIVNVVSKGSGIIAKIRERGFRWLFKAILQRISRVSR
jgi:SAM-dependent methyltransferase